MDNFATLLEKEIPTISQRRASLVATSTCGDILALTGGNILKYGHYSCGELWRVPISTKALGRATLCVVRFNSGADTVLVAGPNFLCAVSQFLILDHILCSSRFFHHHVDRTEPCVIQTIGVHLFLWMRINPP